MTIHPSENPTGTYKMLTDAIVVIFHDAGKGPNNGEQDLRAEATTQMFTVNTL